MVDAMAVHSSTGQRAILNTCALTLVTATSEVLVMGNQWTRCKYMKESLKEDEKGAYGSRVAAPFVSINVVRERERREVERKGKEKETRQ
jgi:hypothetical protein